MQNKVSQRHDFIQDYSPGNESIVSTNIPNITFSQWVPPIQSSAISTTDLGSVNLDDAYSSSTSYLDMDPNMTSTIQYSSVTEDSMNACQSLLPNLGIDKFLLFENCKTFFSVNDNAEDSASINYSNEAMTLSNNAVFSTSFISESSVPSMTVEDTQSVSNTVIFKNELDESNHVVFPKNSDFSKKIEIPDSSTKINNLIQSHSNISEDLHLIINSDDKYKNIEDDVMQLLVTDEQPGISYSISKENGFLIARPTSLCTFPKTEDTTSMDISILESFEDLTNVNTIGLNKFLDKTDINGNLDIATFCMDNSNQNYIPYKVNCDPEINKSLIHIMDKSIPVRALASLPASYLTIKLDKKGNPCGILSCKLILPKVRFGPLEGIQRIVSTANNVKCLDSCFFLQADTNIIQIDVSDEHTSNWMRYVHFEPGAKQNLILEQIGQELYFITSSTIDPGTELVLGYGSYYQKKWSSIFPELIKEKESELDWSCCKCAKEFSSSFELNTHLDLHRQEELENIQELDVKPDENIFNEICRKFSNDNLKNIKNDIFVDLAIKNEDGEINESKVKDCSESVDLIFLQSNELIKELPVSNIKVFQFSNGNSEKEIEVYKNNLQINYSAKPFICKYCKRIENGFDNFVNHIEIHFTEENKFNCPLCSQYLKDLSDLKSHMQTHSDLHNNFKCVLCSITFLRQHELTQHTKSDHQRPDGKFSCPICEPTRVFLDYNGIKKHIKALHSIKSFECENCHNKFSSSDKLHTHSMKHSEVKSIECLVCNKQFKRKDKLTAHLKNPHVHFKNEINMRNLKNGTIKSYISHSTSYTKYTFKCHSCHLGFKRRGMLVNHFARCHPEVSRDNVPELQLPILKTTRDYYCQHCEKVYKSSSKRKAHILKNHPGESIPPSYRGVDLGLGEYGKVGGAGYTACVGTISITPHHCPYDPCHKQYASKAKLLQHIRGKHLSKINNTKENGNVFTEENSINKFDNDHKTYFSSNIQKSMETNLKHATDNMNDGMSILKSKLINMPLESIYFSPSKKSGTSLEMEKKSVQMKSKTRNIVMTTMNTSLLENKNLSVGPILSLHTNPSPASIAEITSLSQYTDR